MNGRYFLDHQIVQGMFIRLHDALTEIDDQLTDPTQEDE